MRRYRGCTNGRSTTFVHRARSAHSVRTMATHCPTRAYPQLRSKGKLLPAPTWVTKLHRRSIARSPSTLPGSFPTHSNHLNLRLHLTFPPTFGSSARPQLCPPTQSNASTCPTSFDTPSTLHAHWSPECRDLRLALIASRLGE